MAEHTGPREAARGVVEGVKGKAKEAAGSLLGNEDLEREGQVQQEKAREERTAAKEEADAEIARAKAKAHEVRQESFPDRDAR